MRVSSLLWAVLVSFGGYGLQGLDTDALRRLDDYDVLLPGMIDEAAMTVSHVWQNGGANDMWYSRFLCDTDPLPVTNNVLVTDGGKVDPMNNTNWARVFEVDRSDPGEIVFQLSVKDLSPTNPQGWTTYRAERLPSVYP